MSQLLICYTTDLRTDSGVKFLCVHYLKLRETYVENDVAYSYTLFSLYVEVELRKTLY